MEIFFKQKRITGLKGNSFTSNKKLLMKTRIIKIQYADGRIEFKAQWKPQLSEFLKVNENIFYIPIWGLIVFIASVLIVPLMGWRDIYHHISELHKFDSEDEAKDVIDNHINNIKTEKEAEEKINTLLKVVKKTAIKYP